MFEIIFCVVLGYLIGKMALSLKEHVGNVFKKIKNKL